MSTSPSRLDLRDAACRDYPAEWWTPRSYTGSLAERAKQICAGCPAAQACLDYAEQTGQSRGIWGGMTPKERERRRTGTEAPQQTPAAPRQRKKTRVKEAGRKLKPIPHGTANGYHQHRYRQEPACDACLAAMREESRRRASARRHPCRCGHRRRQHRADQCQRRACGCAHYRPAPDEGAAA